MSMSKIIWFCILAGFIAFVVMMMALACSFLVKAQNEEKESQLKVEREEVQLEAEKLRLQNEIKRKQIFDKMH